jgi:hypothetical protein
MLNKKQRIKLIMMTTHENYGQLLADAYDSWTRKNIKPVRKRAGVYVDYLVNKKDIIISYKSDDNCCCLQGAAIIDKPPIKGFYDDIERIFNLEDRESSDMRAGFDSRIAPIEQSQSFNFGRKVSKIIFGD